MRTFLCAFCGRAFEASRSDAATCGATCRTRLFQARRTIDEARLIRRLTAALVDD